jgi:hypothetical protein
MKANEVLLRLEFRNAPLNPGAINYQWYFVMEIPSL